MNGQTARYVELGEQRQRVADAATVLEQLLLDLARNAKDAAEQVRRGAVADLGDVHGAARSVARAEEAHDLALLDLRTASGEDA